VAAAALLVFRAEQPEACSSARSAFSGANEAFEDWCPALPLAANF
jgi:hypothetical protein